MNKTKRWGKTGGEFDEMEDGVWGGYLPEPEPWIDDLPDGWYFGPGQFSGAYMEREGDHWVVIAESIGGSQIRSEHQTETEAEDRLNALTPKDHQA